jgi:hypothetical protein
VLNGWIDDSEDRGSGLCGGWDLGFRVTAHISKAVENFSRCSSPLNGYLPPGDDPPTVEVCFVNDGRDTSELASHPLPRAGISEEGGPSFELFGMLRREWENLAIRLLNAIHR